MCPFGPAGLRGQRSRARLGVGDAWRWVSQGWQEDGPLGTGGLSRWRAPVGPDGTQAGKPLRTDLGEQLHGTVSVPERSGA